MHDAAVGLAQGAVNTTDPTGYSDRDKMWLDRWVAKLVRNPADVALGRVPIVFALVTWPLAAGAAVLAAHDLLTWWMALVVSTVIFSSADRFGAFIHELVHTKIYKPEHAYVSTMIEWGLMPLIGMGPYFYRGLHIGMHHVENNGPGDFHSTMPVARDRFLSHLRLWLKVIFLTDIAVVSYLYRRQRRRMFRGALLGVCVHVTLLVAATAWNVWFGVGVFILPLFLSRIIAGLFNSCEHLLVDPDEPYNMYTNSVLCINTEYNHRLFNAVYHSTHHVRPSVLWHQLPERFAVDLVRCRREGTLIFEGINHVQAFFLLVRRRYEALALRCVQDPDHPMSIDETARLIAYRSTPIRREVRASNRRRSDLASEQDQTELSS